MASSVSPELKMATEVKSLKETVEKLLHAQADGQTRVKPKEVFGRFSPSGTSKEWPVEQLQEMAGRLSKSYNRSTAEMIMRQAQNGQAKTIGWGPALARLAQLECRNVQKDPSYGHEQLEREHGFITMRQYEEKGIKELDGVIRKASALSENAGILGGYVVPPDWKSELLTIAAEDATIEPRAQVVPMPTRTMTYPMLDITTNYGTGNTPYYGGIIGTWNPEANPIPQTNSQFRQTELTAWDLELYCVSSNQLIQDNGIGLDAVLTSLFAGAMTWYSEYAYHNGRGAGNSMPLGVLNAPCTIGIDRATSNVITMADGAAMIAKHQMRSWGKSCWYTHQSCIPQFINMLGNSGTSANLSWLNPWNPSGNGGPATGALPQAFLDNQPLYITEKVQQLGTTGDLRLVDWSKYLIGKRLDIQIAVSDQFLFQTNQIAWRVIVRETGLPWLQNVITDAQGWTISPFVVLDVHT